MESDNTAVGDTATADAVNVEPVKLESLTALLEENPATVTASEGAEDGAAAGDGEKSAKPKLEMFNDLAESSGLELDDLYALKVSTTDGKSVSIEELKALQSSQDAIAIRELEFEEVKATKEGDLRQAQNELAEIVAALPADTITPAVMEKLRAKNAARTELEQSRTLAAIPGWSDEATRTADITGMATHLERFGFPANYLASVVDHRQFIFIRESYMREQRINKALAKVRAGAPNPTTPTKATGKTAGKKGASKRSNARNGLESFFNNA